VGKHKKRRKKPSKAQRYDPGPPPKHPSNWGDFRTDHITQVLPTAMETKRRKH
jgi:hypothetical protein